MVKEFNYKGKTDEELQSLSNDELFSILNTKFDDRTKYIIHNRYLSDKSMTLSDLSQKLGISLERVRQIESKALNSLSSKLKKYKQ